MSWERRGKGRHYYRTVRQNGHRKRIYVGSGAAGEAAAREDVLRREQLVKARVKLAAIKAKLAAAELAQDELSAWTKILAKAVMLLGGQHQHHGIWRRRVLIAWNSKS